MKTSHLKLSLLTSLLATAGIFNLQAANLTWDADAIATSGAQDGAGNWASLTSNTNWWDGAANVTWNNATPDNAIFGSGSGAAGTVTVPSTTTNTVGNITFNAPGSGVYNLAAGSSSTSKINLSGTTINVASGVFATNLVVLSGTSFTKLGAGTFVLKPGAANVNAGTTVVGNGTLIIGSSNSRLLIPGDLLITNGATALLGANEQISDTATITVNGGIFDTGGKSETTANIILDNSGQIISSSSSAALTNSGLYDLRSGVVFPNLTGAAGLTKTTAGLVILTNGAGANTYTGPTLISAGTLQLGHSGAGQGLPASTVTITNTGTLLLGKDTQINPAATVYVAGGTFELLAHSESVSTVILDNGGFIGNGGNTSKTLSVNTSLDFRSGLCSSRLGGTGLLTKTTSGTVTLTMDNTNNGGALISAGILQLGDNSSTNRGQIGGGLVTNNAAIVLNHSGAFNLTNTISGSGSITNLQGTPTLNANNSYGGGTTVLGGTLIVNNTTGSGTGSGAVTVTNGTLGGNGIIGGTVTIQPNGTLAPGAAATGLGTITINNTLNLNGNTIIEVTNVPTCDQVVASTVNYGGTLTVSVLGSTVLTAGNSFQIFTAGSHTGNFSSISGTPGAGLTWSFNPATGILSVVGGVVNPPTLNSVQSGNTLTFSWTDTSFKLQSQTNALGAGLGTNWSYYSDISNPVNVNINPSNPTVFYRLSQ